MFNKVFATMPIFLTLILWSLYELKHQSIVVLSLCISNLKSDYLLDTTARY